MKEKESVFNIIGLPIFTRIYQEFFTPFYPEFFTPFSRPNERVFNTIGFIVIIDALVKLWEQSLHDIDNY